jgi:hypothetical protein
MLHKGYYGKSSVEKRNLWLWVSRLDAKMRGCYIRAITTRVQLKKEISGCGS